ncbi:hypothetical protein IE81DRAFT_293049 [Ceraceosorus guamensis]|uniref:Uncharacterized protein n=1 Tax=Ceraceosorus guamensis TaxID=1522189 RepID=A0A316VTF6_9BASI|nr:hypothetical protein IE81DRAFT_293049 [Ceraceosorus guamensis]PWN40670.1 hypothetical protein IE81DRAFT_293049 [Ceraceosorus guamensis]
MLLPSNKTAKQTSTLVIFENSRSVLLYDRGEANPSSSSSTVALPSKSASGTTSLLPSAVVSTAGRGGNPATGTCRPKGCRKDEFPFGYKGIPTELLPPLCGPGSYCPDEESACQSLIPIGGDCELNRDDSCSPPSGGLSSAPAVKRQHGLFLPGVSSSSTVKAICLAGRCTLASVQLGQGCVLDHTQYLGYDMNGKEVGETVSRDDCHEGLYCDSTSSTCMAEKPYGEGCGSDRECTEYNCNSRHLCDLPPEAPHRLPSWAFGLVGLGIFAFLAMTVTLLYRTHTAHRVARADEIDRYFSEQWTYRQSILAMHAAFVASGVAASELLTGSNLLSADQGGHSAAAGHDGTLNESKGEQKGRAQDQTRVNNVASAAIPSRRMFAEDEDDARDATSQTPQAVIRRKPAPAV